MPGPDTLDAGTVAARSVGDAAVCGEDATSAGEEEGDTLAHDPTESTLSS
jgi:hypothetical protein